MAERGFEVDHSSVHRWVIKLVPLFEKAIYRSGAPETVTMDKSGANLAALQPINADRETPIKIRQVKYLNNIVEQDHQAIKRRIRPMMGFNDSGVLASSGQALRQCT